MGNRPISIDYASPRKPDAKDAGSKRVGNPATVTMFVLAVPCLGNLALLVAMFLCPSLGERTDLGPFVLGCMVGLPFIGLASAVVGVIVFFVSDESSGVVWLLLAVFIATALVDILLVLYASSGGFGMG
jgi:hypothetical protein